MLCMNSAENDDILLLGEDLKGELHDLSMEERDMMFTSNLASAVETKLPSCDIQGPQLTVEENDPVEEPSLLSYMSFDTPRVATEWPWDLEQANRRRLQEGTHDCVFIHGLGQTLDGPSQTSFKEYWGRLHDKYKPHFCRSTKFVRLDTLNYSWWSPYLHQRVCDELNPDEERVVHETAVYTHSMGNLILAQAFTTGQCTLGKSSAWVSRLFAFSRMKQWNFDRNTLTYS